MDRNLENNLADDVSTTVEAALASRRSIRAFLERPVARDAIEDMLRLASFAPSGSNFQPWRVYVLSGNARWRLTQVLKEAYLSNVAPSRDYPYYMDPIEEPFLARRRLCGWGLYKKLEIERHEKERMTTQRARNYDFYDAPVGLIFTIDKRLETGSYLDYGMFIQSVALAARGKGLHSCIQAAMSEYPDLVRRELGLSSDELVLCGMALGYADPKAIVNEYRPSRRPVEDFTSFIN
jgi:nitroreductase